MDFEWLSKKRKSRIIKDADAKLMQVFANRKDTLMVKPVSPSAGLDIGAVFSLKKKGGAL